MERTTPEKGAESPGVSYHCHYNYCYCCECDTTISMFTSILPSSCLPSSLFFEIQFIRFPSLQFFFPSPHLLKKYEEKNQKLCPFFINNKTSKTLLTSPSFHFSATFGLVTPSFKRCVIRKPLKLSLTREMLPSLSFLSPIRK